MKTPILFLFSALSVLVLTQCKSHDVSGSMEEMTHQERADAAWPEKAPRGEIDFVRHVRPILEIRCLECHNSKDGAKYSGFNWETKKSAFTTGARAPVIVAGRPDKSFLIQVLQLDYDHPTSMPPAPDKVWGASLEILEKWIAQGAIWPDGVRLVPPQEWKS